MSLALFLCLLHKTWTFRGPGRILTTPCFPETGTETWHLVELEKVMESVSFAPQNWQVIHFSDPRQNGNNNMLTNMWLVWPYISHWGRSYGNANLLNGESLLSPGSLCGWRTETCAEISIIQDIVGWRNKCHNKHSRSGLPNMLATSTMWPIKLDKI